MTVTSGSGERLEELMRSWEPDPGQIQHEDFYVFSENYWIRNRWQMHGGSLVPLLRVPGAEVTVEDIMLRSAVEVELAIDISERNLGKYTWHLNSTNPHSTISQQISVSGAELSGTIEVREDPEILARRLAWWEASKELIWDSDRMHNRRPSLGPNPTGRIEHKMSRVILSRLIKVTQELAMTSSVLTKAEARSNQHQLTHGRV